MYELLSASGVAESSSHPKNNSVTDILPKRIRAPASSKSSLLHLHVLFCMALLPQTVCEVSITDFGGQTLTDLPIFQDLPDLPSDATLAASKTSGPFESAPPDSANKHLEVTKHQDSSCYQVPTRLSKNCYSCCCPCCRTGTMHLHPQKHDFHVAGNPLLQQYSCRHLHESAKQKAVLISQTKWHAGKAWIKTTGPYIDLGKSLELSAHPEEWSADVATSRGMQAESVTELLRSGAEFGHFTMPNGPPPAKRLQLATLHSCQVQQLNTTGVSSEATLFNAEWSTGGRIKLKGIAKNDPHAATILVHVQMRTQSGSPQQLSSSMRQEVLDCPSQGSNHLFHSIPSEVNTALLLDLWADMTALDTHHAPFVQQQDFHSTLLETNNTSMQCAIHEAAHYLQHNYISGNASRIVTKNMESTNRHIHCMTAAMHATPCCNLLHHHTSSLWIEPQ